MNKKLLYKHYLMGDSMEYLVNVKPIIEDLITSLCKTQPKPNNAVKFLI